MQQFASKIFGDRGLGIASSIFLHLVLALVLFVRLPELPSTPEQIVNVDIVPPPPAPKTPEEKPVDKPDEKPEEKPTEAALPQSAPQAFESTPAQVNDQTPPPSEERAMAEKSSESEKANEAAQPIDEMKQDAPADIKPELTELHARSDDALSQSDAVAQTKPVPDDKPTPEPTTAEEPPAPEAAEFTQAKTLYSKDMLSDPRVKQAMGKLAPKERVVQICSIEALEQIRHQRRGTFPDILARGASSVSSTALVVTNGAFRSRAQWYSVDFRCQVNADATSIQSFQYVIGQRIPESEWNKRQLPRD